MKQIGRLLFMGMIFGTFLISQSCKKGTNPGESIEDIQLGKLSKTWNLSSAELDTQPQDGYDNFSLIVAGTAGNTSFGYTANGRPQLSPWPSSGTWSFGTSPETQIIRDPGTSDELAITYAVSDTQLQITFNFTGPGYQSSRTTNVKGEWVFTFQ